MRGGRVLAALLLVAGCGADGSTSASVPVSVRVATTGSPATAPPVVSASTSVPIPAASSAAPTTTIPPPTTERPPEENELDGDWQVMSGNVNGVPVELIDDAPITLTVEGTTLSGVAACNEYEFTASFGNRSVDIVTGYATDIGCLATGVTELEQLYLESLGPSATYMVDDTTLTWESPSATWVFTRVPPTPSAALVGSTWVLNGVINEFGAFTVPGIEAAHIVFVDDGTFRGSTGCREFTGTWVLAGDTVQTDDVTVAGECTGALTDVDEVVVQVLDAGFAGSIDGDHLGARPRDDLGLDYFAES